MRPKAENPRQELFERGQAELDIGAAVSPFCQHLRVVKLFLFQNPDDRRPEANPHRRRRAVAPDQAERPGQVLLDLEVSGLGELQPLDVDLRDSIDLERPDLVVIAGPADEVDAPLWKTRAYGWTS